MYLFEIAIYRCRQEQFHLQFTRDLSAHLDWLRKCSGLSCEQAQQSYLMTEMEFRKSYGGPWRYNQVIGWLRLYANPSSINADLWLCYAKRFNRRMRHKRFCFFGTEMITKCPLQLSSTGIFEQISIEFSKYETAWRRRGYSCDLECFKRIGPFINWRAVVDNAGPPHKTPVQLFGFNGTPLAISISKKF